jgi:hypothetical protein
MRILIGASFSPGCIQGSSVAGLYDRPHFVEFKENRAAIDHPYRGALVAVVNNSAI